MVDGVFNGALERRDGGVLEPPDGFPHAGLDRPLSLLAETGDFQVDLAVVFGVSFPTLSTLARLAGGSLLLLLATPCSCCLLPPGRRCCSGGACSSSSLSSKYK